MLRLCNYVYILKIWIANFSSKNSSKCPVAGWTFFLAPYPWHVWLFPILFLIEYLHLMSCWSLNFLSNIISIIFPFVHTCNDFNHFSLFTTFMLENIWFNHFQLSLSSYYSIFSLLYYVFHITYWWEIYKKNLVLQVISYNLKLNSLMRVRLH